MSAWSREHAKQWIADAAQAAHVPSFPLRDLAEHLASPQLRHRGFWRDFQVDGRTIKMPAAPVGATLHPGIGLAAAAKRSPRDPAMTASRGVSPGDECAAP